MNAITAPLAGVLQVWRRRWPALAFGALVSLLAAAAGVAVMLAAGSSLYGTALPVGVGLAAGLALRGVGLARILLRYFERLATHAAMFRALADMRVWFFRGLARQSAGGLGWRRSGEVLGRLVDDVEALDGLYLRLLVPLIAAAGLFVGSLWLVGRGSLTLALAIGVLFLLAALYFPWRAARDSWAAAGRLGPALATLRITVLDTMAGMREVRAFGAEGRRLALIQSQEAALIAAQHALARRAAIAQAAVGLCAAGAMAAALAAAMIWPELGVTVFVALAAFEATGTLARAGVYAGHAAGAAERVLAIGATDAAAPPPAPDTPLPRGNALRFDAVSFRWAADRDRVLDGLSLDIPSGAHVALLGPSGAGKSTLAALALAIAHPDAGRVLLGGIDIATLPPEAVRARIALLSQRTHLFDDTIRANLLLARPDADEAALWRALEAARIADVVRDLPAGLDTVVGEGGARFSGGQGRRLALARTLLSPAPVLILDEPCAGLDADTERAFLATLGEATAGRSVLLIVHRLVGVERMDRIYRLSSGKAVSAAG